MVPIEGGAERQLTDMAGRLADFNHPKTDGKFFYFLSPENTGDLWVMDVVVE